MGMNREQIRDSIKELAQSQGFYSRLYRGLMETKKNVPEAYESYMAELEAKNLKDTVDLVLYLES